MPCLDDGANNCRNIIPSRIRRKTALVDADSVLKDKLHTMVEIRLKEEDEESIGSSNFVTFSHSAAPQPISRRTMVLVRKIERSTRAGYIQRDVTFFVESATIGSPIDEGTKSELWIVSSSLSSKLMVSVLMMIPINISVARLGASGQDISSDPCIRIRSAARHVFKDDEFTIMSPPASLVSAKNKNLQLRGIPLSFAPRSSLVEGTISSKKAPSIGRPPRDCNCQSEIDICSLRSAHHIATTVISEQGNMKSVFSTKRSAKISKRSTKVSTKRSPKVFRKKSAKISKRSAKVSMKRSAKSPRGPPRSPRRIPKGLYEKVRQNLQEFLQISKRSAKVSMKRYTKVSTKKSAKVSKKRSAKFSTKRSTRISKRSAKVSTKLSTPQA
ncbi:hypothetical protein M9H77_29568 [Catharanthus roseus]|uniref:Uncharacterized protein n=1 Tax=Catharanthus roseus TaxID=4058 RepID=A0ACB9ZYM7_CATRO|nr:hypothetical protein M9H77_29568 [Catharanthus roseus]